MAEKSEAVGRDVLRRQEFAAGVSLRFVHGLFADKIGNFENVMDLKAA
jgi:hypothetical protein